MLLLAWSFSSVKCMQPATFLVQVAPLPFYLQSTKDNWFVPSSLTGLRVYLIHLPEPSSLYRFNSRGGTSSVRNLRAWAPVPHQWHWVPRRLARTQRWHHQLRQLPVCHADSVSVHHHGGLDWRAVLGELPPAPSPVQHLRTKMKWVLGSDTAEWCDWRDDEAADGFLRQLLSLWHDWLAKQQHNACQPFTTSLWLFIYNIKAWFGSVLPFWSFCL